MTSRPPSVRSEGLEDEATEVDYDLRNKLRARLLAALERKRLTVAQVATRTGYHERTVQRIVSGKTLSLETLTHVARMLRIDLSCDAHDAPASVDVRRRTDSSERPVQGWRQAAMALGISRSTLYERRRVAGCKRWPWWSSEDAVMVWFDGLIGEAG